jgi:hypothetical protein
MVCGMSRGRSNSKVQLVFYSLLICEISVSLSVGWVKFPANIRLFGIDSYEPGTRKKLLKQMPRRANPRGRGTQSEIVTLRLEVRVLQEEQQVWSRRESTH